MILWLDLFNEREDTELYGIIYTIFISFTFYASKVIDNNFYLNT